MVNFLKWHLAKNFDGITSKAAREDLEIRLRVSQITIVKESKYTRQLGLAPEPSSIRRPMAVLDFNAHLQLEAPCVDMTPRSTGTSFCSSVDG
jgi:hypothetical protein